MRNFRKILAVVSLIVCADSLEALEVGIGATCWYAWWNPMFENRMLNVQRYIDKTGQEVRDTRNSTELEPSVLGGPVFTIGLTDRISFSGAFVYGPFYHARSEYSNYVVTYDVTNTIQDSMDIKKYDSDMVLSYRLGNFMNVFMGLKYQGYRYEGTRHQIVHGSLPPDSTYSGEYSVGYDAIGTGAGAGFQAGLVDNYFWIITLSAVYLRSQVTAHGTQLIDGTPYWLKDDDSLTFNVYGININPQLAYRSGFSGLAVLFGFRFQYLKYYVARTRVKLEYNGSLNPDTARNCESMMRDDYDGTEDVFWGITLSLVYSFTI